MGDRSKIEWTDATWNPITGCTPVSAGCANCYAARMEGRNLPGHHQGPFTEVAFHPERLEQPFHLKRPRRIFVCSMGDLFHGNVEVGWILDVFHRMADASQHTYMLLTKRPERAKRIFGMMADPDFIGRVLPNVWLGVTAENQEMADQRIPILLQTPAAKRFVSVEPCLSMMDLSGWGSKMYLRTVGRDGSAERPGLDWCILGGETGTGARYMPGPVPQSLRDQCVSAGVPFFFKGWGTFGMKKSYPNYMKIDGREWKQFPDGFSKKDQGRGR